MVTIVRSSRLDYSPSGYVKITWSDMTANLIKLGILLITHGYEQGLLPNPKNFFLFLSITSI
jgi:hypothetical protein